MSLTTTTGITLMLSTLIYHGGLAYLFVRAQFLDVLKLPREKQLVIIARHPEEYRWGCRIVLIGWIAAALGYVMLAALLREAGDPILSTLAAVLFLLAIGAAIIFWAFCVTPTLLAAEVTTRTPSCPNTTQAFNWRPNRHWASTNCSPCWLRLGLDGRCFRPVCCQVGWDGSHLDLGCSGQQYS
jgi:hypothetical protein